MAGATCFNDTIHGRLCSVAATRPDSPAVLHLRAPGRAAVVFSFAELVAASQALAVVLRASARVPPGADEGAVPCVAVLLDSTPARIVAYFAVLFAQLAFCPLELGHPRSVLRATLDAVRPVLLVSTPELASSLLGEEAGGDVVPRVLLCPHTGTPLLVRRGCDDGSGAPPRVVPRTPFAHASFTSGTTTGTPRCMAVGHGGSLASHAWRASLAQPSSTDVTACNVFGVWDAACSLLSGSPVALVPDGVARDGAAHGRALLRVGAIRLLLTPSLAARLLDDPVGAAAVGRLRVLTLCGERLSPFLRRALVNALPRGAALVNLYSLAEAHDVGAHVTRVGEESADSTVDEGAPLSVGRLAPHAGAGRVSSDGQLWLRGTHIAAAALRPSPAGLFPRPLNEEGPCLALPTGDVARFSSDGELFILGRYSAAPSTLRFGDDGGGGCCSDKLKLPGGTTADAATVEAAIVRAMGGACAAAAVTQQTRDGAAPRGTEHSGDGGGDRGFDDSASRLVAWLVPSIAAPPAAAAGAAPHRLPRLDAAGVRGAMVHAGLPRGWLPARVVLLRALPLGPTGKLDRAALGSATPLTSVEDDDTISTAVEEADAGLYPSSPCNAAPPALLCLAVSLFEAFAPPPPPLQPSPARHTIRAHTDWIVDLGGTSVGAAALLARAAASDAAPCGAGGDGDDTGLSLCLAEFLGRPTPAALALMLRSARRQHGSHRCADGTRDWAAVQAKLAACDAETLIVTAPPSVAAAAASLFPPRSAGRVLLFGATGCVGSHILASLVASNVAAARADPRRAVLVAVRHPQRSGSGEEAPSFDGSSAESRTRAVDAAAARVVAALRAAHAEGNPHAASAAAGDGGCGRRGWVVVPSPPAPDGATVDDEAESAFASALLASHGAVDSIVFAAGFVSLASPYLKSSRLRADNVLLLASALRLAARLRVHSFHLVSSTVVASDPEQSVGLLAEHSWMNNEVPAGLDGGYALAKRACERLAARFAAATNAGGRDADSRGAAAVSIYRGGYIACGASPCAQATVLAACLAVGASPEAAVASREHRLSGGRDGGTKWCLQWLSGAAFGAAIAIAVAASSSAEEGSSSFNGGVLVSHQPPSTTPPSPPSRLRLLRASPHLRLWTSRPSVRESFATALHTLSPPAPPVIPTRVWVVAVRGGAAAGGAGGGAGVSSSVEPSGASCAALCRAAALLAAVGADSALGGADAGCEEEGGAAELGECDEENGGEQKREAERVWAWLRRATRLDDDAGQSDVQQPKRVD